MNNFILIEKSSHLRLDVDLTGMEIIKEVQVDTSKTENLSEFDSHLMELIYQNVIE